MKITPQHFEAFKKSFLFWQKEFGMVDYRASFRIEKMESSIATIDFNHSGKRCFVALNTELPAGDAAEFDPARHAKHEAIHLLLSRLFHLASLRCVTARELEDTEEGLVRTLENLL